MDVKNFITLAPGSTGVEYSTHNTRVEGSNTVTRTGREILAKKT